MMTLQHCVSDAQRELCEMLARSFNDEEKLKGRELFVRLGVTVDLLTDRNVKRHGRDLYQRMQLPEEITQRYVA
jgi:hypothetical protein